MNLTKVTENEDGDKGSLDIPRIEVRGKTLVFDNSIYQISNISAVEVGTIKKPIPWLFWVILFFAGVLYLTEYRVESVVALVAAAGTVYYWANQKEYGLIIRLNSGLTNLIVSSDLDFLRSIAVVLQNVMNSEADKSLTFNLDQRTIVDNVSGSTVVLGNTTGDIVNRVAP